MRTTTPQTLCLLPILALLRLPADGPPEPATRPSPVTLATLLAPADYPLPEADPEALRLGGILRTAATLAGPEPRAALLRLRALGPAASRVLVDLLAGGPLQARQAAAVLLGDPAQPPAALAPLCRALADPALEVALAAALSLRDRRDPRAAPRLLLELLPEAAGRTPALAAASAAALLELGSPAGVPLLLAILQAGIPGSAELEARHGLPSKETWALEKEIALRALRRLSGLRFGLEPEQGYADQLQGAKRWAAWWAAEGAPKFPPPCKELAAALADASSRVKTALPGLPAPEAARARAWLAGVEALAR